MFSIFVLLAVVGIVGAVVYFATRGGSARDDAFSARNLVRVYVRTAFLVSLLLALMGASQLLTVGFSQVFGKDFSYPRLPPGMVVTSGGLFGSSTTSGSSLGCDSAGAQGSAPLPAAPVTPRTAATPQPAPPTSSRLLSPSGCPATTDTRQQDDLFRGLSLLVTGLLFGVIHLVPRRRLETPGEREFSAIARLDHALGAVVLGVTAIVLVPAAVYALIHYVVYGAPDPNPGFFSSQNDQPGPLVAVALVFVPAWVYYLVRLVRGIRGAAAGEGSVVDP